MRERKVMLSFISRLIQGLGAGLFISGSGFSIWFFFFSMSQWRIEWGILSLLEMVVGYMLYSFAIKRIFDDTTNWH